MSSSEPRKESIEGEYDIEQDNSSFVHPMLETVEEPKEVTKEESLMKQFEFDPEANPNLYVEFESEDQTLQLLQPSAIQEENEVAAQVATAEEELWAQLASIQPRKWKSLGSEAEVDQEILKLGRPLAVMEATRDKELFFKEYSFSDSKTDGNPHYYVEFESEDRSLHPYILAAEVDAGVQTTGPKKTMATQTQFHFKRNKMVQHEGQIMSEEDANTLFESDDVVDFFKRVTNRMERALQQNELLNIVEDDYKNLKAVKGNEVEFNNESILLQEYITFCELRHSKGRHVTMITFHPTLDDMIVMSLSEDATFDKREDSHSKMLVAPNFVLFWDLKNPGAPQLMLDSPDDVFSFHINPADPTLVCGGCANGQVVLWDLSDFYWDLKSRESERRRSSAETKAKRLSFLEKLKDSAEKYVAPLVPSTGLSNLEQSHHSAVTAIKWLSPHCEIRKNGTIIENTMRGGCSQFFSLAGDSTLRLWDIRQPKSGMDEDEEIEVDNVIRSNKWLHLENNKWKYSLKFNLDDGSGTMYATLMSLSESSHGRYDVDPGEDDLSANNSELSIKSNSSRISKMNVDSSISLKSKKSESGFSNDSNVSSSSSHAIHSLHDSTHSDIHGDFDRDDAFDGDNEEEGDEGPIKPKNYRRGPILLPDAKSSIFIGTDEGQIGLIDWLKDREGNVTSEGATPNKTCNNIYIEMAHSGSITSIARSPFYHSLILVVGGGIISLWKEGSPKPILVTCGSEFFPWCGVWSNTRPAVFFIGTREGALQVWDLIDRSHGPVLTQQITPGRITCCAMAYKLTGKKHFLSLGDSLGNLHVLLIPKFYSKPLSHENNTMKELMAREEKRMNAWALDQVPREMRNEEISRAWNDARALKTNVQAKKEEEDVEYRLNHEYLDFLEFQAGLLAKLKSEEPPLPNAEPDVDAEFERVIEEARRREFDKLHPHNDEDETVHQEPEDCDSMFAALQEREKASLAQLTDQDDQDENDEIGRKSPAARPPTQPKSK